MLKYYILNVLLYMRLHISQADLENYLRVVMKYLYFVPSLVTYILSLGRVENEARVNKQ